MATWNMMQLPDAASPMMENLIFFHDHTMVVIMFIMMFVFYIMMVTLTNYLFNNMILKNHLMEMIWSFFPVILLTLIALPSLKLLYQMEEIHDPLISIKCFGHQWYWSYELTNWKNIEFDSYMLPQNEMETFRLLNVDNKIKLPIFTDTRFLVSSLDVIHSWTIPSMGVKVDAVPGHINQIFFSPYRLGIFFGQCSEICGSNHSFMPISVMITSLEEFKQWAMNY